MAWIESHQALGHHPKTLALADLLGCNLPAAVGYVHYLWWWAMDYASDGRLPDDRQTVLARACEWHGKPERFWPALAKAGFIEERDGGWWLHDWQDYSGAWVEKRRRDAERKRVDRATRPADVPGNGARTAHVPDQPDRTNRTVPLNPLAGQAADSGGPDVAPPRAAASGLDKDVTELRSGWAQCPQCRLPYSGPYIEHSATAHPVHREPGSGGNLDEALARRRRSHLPPPPPPDVAAQFEAMHEHLQQVMGDNGPPPTDDTNNHR